MQPTQSNTYALGSYSGQGQFTMTSLVPAITTLSLCLTSVVGVYSEDTKGPTLLLKGVGGGVTHITFSTDGNLLFVGFRKVCSLNSSGPCVCVCVFANRVVS